MKKAVSLLLSLLLLLSCLPVAVFAEGDGETPTVPSGGADIQKGVLPITATVGSNSSFERGDVILQVTLQNLSNSNIDINKVEIQGGGFNPASSDNVPVVLEAGGSVTVNIQAYYNGRGNRVTLKVQGKRTNDGMAYGDFVTNILVSGAPQDDTTSGEITPVDAKLYIQSIGNDVVRSGGSNAFPITVGAADYADNVHISVAGEGDYANKFSLEGGNFGNLGDGDTLTPYLRVANNVPDGEYQLTFTFKYSNYGTSFESTDTCMVTVHGKAGESAYLHSAVFQTAKIGKENKSKIKVNVMNPMKASIWNVNVSFVPNENFSLYENFQPVVLPSISANSYGTAEFSMYVASGVATGNYPLTFTISYEDATGDVHASTETIYAQVTRTEDAGQGGDGKASQPRIRVASYSTDTEQIQAGKAFTLDFALENTSATTAVSNVKVVLSSDMSSGDGNSGSGSNGVFFPAEGSNSFFIDQIGAKKTSSNTIKLMTSQSVEPGVYAVILDIEYEGANGQSYTSKEQIAFPVSQEQRLEIQGFTPPTDGMEGSPIPLSFQYINKGKATIYNFSIAIEGDFYLDGGDTYIGNLSAGYNDFFDGMIYPQKGASPIGSDAGMGAASEPVSTPEVSGDEALPDPLAEVVPDDGSDTGMLDGGDMGMDGMDMGGMASGGEYQGALVLKYEDSQGNPKEVRKEFTVNIQPMDVNGGGDMPWPDGFEMDFETGYLKNPATGELLDPITLEPIPQGPAVWVIIVCCVAGVLVAGGAVFAVIFIRKKRRAKKDLIEDEEE